MVKIPPENFVINGLTLFLFKKDINCHKSYDNIQYKIMLI